MVLLLASQHSQLTVFVVVLVFGVAVAVLGHLASSRPLILTGLLIIGLVTAYFSFVLQPGAR